MDKITIISKLYAQVLEYGFVDTLRPSAPDQTDPGYIAWLVQTGSFKVLVFSIDFCNALAAYFVAKNVSDPIALTGVSLLGATITAVDPINFLGVYLAEALLSDADFTKLIADTKATLDAQTGMGITLTLSDDKKTAAIQLGTYTNSITVDATTTLEIYQKLTGALKDLSTQFITALIQKGAQAYTG